MSTPGDIAARVDFWATQIEDLTDLVAVYVDATEPFVVPSRPYGDYADQLTEADLAIYQERVANLDRFVADGRALADQVAWAASQVAQLRGTAIAYSADGDSPDDRTLHYDNLYRLGNLVTSAEELRNTLADWIEQIRLVYGAAVSDADNVAAELASRCARQLLLMDLR